MRAVVNASDPDAPKRPGRCMFATHYQLPSGQLRYAHQVPVALPCRLATFVDRPDDEALAAAAVAGDEDVRHVRGIPAVVSLVPAHRAAAFANLDAELIGDRMLGAQESHRQ